jgi:hypothetical protein
MQWVPLNGFLTTAFVGHEFLPLFRVFTTPMLLKPEKAAIVSMTCALLHNFLRRSNTSRQSKWQF